MNGLKILGRAGPSELGDERMVFVIVVPVIFGYPELEYLSFVVLFLFCFLCVSVCACVCILLSALCLFCFVVVVAFWGADIRTSHHVRLDEKKEQEEQEEAEKNNTRSRFNFCMVFLKDI